MKAPWVAALGVLFLSSVTTIGCDSSGGGKAGTGGETSAGDSGATAGASGSGGAPGAAGAAGAAGGGAGGNVIVPAACPVGGGAVGVWQDITPAAFMNPPNLEATCIVVDPRDNAVLAAAGNVTNGGACPAGTVCPKEGTGIYKSDDCGATWSKVSKTKDLETGSCFGLTIDPKSPDTMYYNNGYGNNPTVWKSVDGGVNWVPLATDTDHVLQYNFVNSTALDPGDSQHLLVVYHENCKAPHAPQCLAESTDGGATWRQLKGPEANGWMEGASAAIFDATHWFYASNAGGWFTSDRGATWEPVICPGAADPSCTRVQGSVTGPHVARDGVAYVGVTNTGILSSRADPSATPPIPLGKRWTLIPKSPQAVHLDDDGISLYSSFDEPSGHPFKTAKLADLSTWTTMDSPVISRRGGATAYDAARHILYSTNNVAGVWRLVTR